MTDIINPELSKRPIQTPGHREIMAMQRRADELVEQIEHLEQVQEALEKDDNWRIVSEEMAKRFKKIPLNFFTECNPSDPNLRVKYAAAWGQFHEILGLTERQIGVKSEIEKLRSSRQSVLERIKSALDKIVKGK